MHADSTSSERTRALAERFETALEHLAEARSFARPRHIAEVLDRALQLLRQPGGVEVLYGFAPRYDQLGLFEGGDWEHPARLMPRLVTQSLHSHGQLLAIEVLSELRFVAIADGDADHPEVTPEQAREFLEDVLAFNLDLLFPPESSEASRTEAGPFMEGVRRHLELVADHVEPQGILESIVDEAERVLEQRPILVDRARALVETAARTVAQSEAGSEEAATNVGRRAARLVSALHGPTEASRHAETPEAYDAQLAVLDAQAFRHEAEAMGDSMWITGLVCPQHASLLIRAAESEDALDLAAALGLGPVGRGALHDHDLLVRSLVREAIHPATCQSIYGLASLLECGILFFPPVPPGLRRLMGLPIRPEVVTALQDVTPDPDLSPNALLLAGTFSVLGQPLGVGQGDNPTCQSARAISLWAQVDPGYLLELITQAARDDEIVMHFEGQSIASRDLEAGEVRELHTRLDPVSRVLVPHLDRVYGEMSRQVVGRGEDGHKWINPELHGWWVQRGFAIAVDLATGGVSRFDDFVRLFYATHHPDFRGPYEPLYPQPAGVSATNLWGGFLGWHAVSILRAERDPDGDVRVYFYNPNNDSGQRWGQGIVTSTSGHGEHPGEASLPFELFVARLYVFHYDPREMGDPAEVPWKPVQRIRALVAESWGAEREWLD